MHRSIVLLSPVLALLCGVPTSAHAAVLVYGDEDLVGFGYPAGIDPTAGATLQGLLPNSVTLATNSYGHSYPFSPSPSDYPGTDQIYVGTVQTASRDGYSEYSGRLPGPQVITLDYNSLVSAGQTVTTLTLGLGADDFQFPDAGDPFTASINGIPNIALANALMALEQSGPLEQFLSIGIDPAVLSPSGILTLSINEGGDGGDGWSLDFLTVGVTTASAPEPASLGLLAFSSLALLTRRSRHAR